MDGLVLIEGAADVEEVTGRKEAGFFVEIITHLTATRESNSMAASVLRPGRIERKRRIARKGQKGGLRGSKGAGNSGVRGGVTYGACQQPETSEKIRI